MLREVGAHARTHLDEGAQRAGFLPKGGLDVVSTTPQGRGQSS